MSLRNYGLVARFYEGLAFIYSGGLILRARQAALEGAKSVNKLAIVGVGAGAELETAVIQASSIDAFDISDEMLAQARKSLNGSPRNIEKVRLIQADFFNISGSYDCVICPFFLNVFKQDDFKKIKRRLKSLLSENPSGHLIVVDFSSYKNWWIAPLQWSYYTLPRVLFKILTNNPWHPLYDYTHLLSTEFVLVNRQPVGRLGLFEILRFQPRMTSARSTGGQ